MTNFDGEEPGLSQSGLREAETSKQQDSKKRRRGRRGKWGNKKPNGVTSNDAQPAHSNGAHGDNRKTLEAATQNDGEPETRSSEASPSKPPPKQRQKSNKSTGSPSRGGRGASDDNRMRAKSGEGHPEERAATRSQWNKARPRHKGRTQFRDRPAYAALDLGTNNCRLLVAVPNGMSFRVVDAFSRIVRLGEGIAHTGRLSDEAMDRAVEALKVCAAKIKNRNIKRLRLIATEACRVAENGELFLKRVRDEAGLELEIVDRETEARLAAAGCSSLVDRRSDGAILFDIGGGSSELVWIDLKAGKKRSGNISKFIRTWMSLPVGVVNVSERHGGVRVTQESFEGMVLEVMGMLDEFPEALALSEMVKKGRVHMLGTSGTVTTLAGVHLGLETYDRRKVDGIWMSSDDVTSMTQQLLDMPYEDREKNACIGKDRADLVLAGCAILEALRRKWPCSRLRVADRGLREGILYELMSKDGVLRSSQRPRKRRTKKNQNRTQQGQGKTS